MDAATVGLFFGGTAFGWLVRGWFPDKQESPKCVCECHCAQPRSPETSGLGIWAVAGVILLTCLVLGAAGFALAVKLTVVRRGEEREVAIHLKGKSRGVYNPAHPLQILG